LQLCWELRPRWGLHSHRPGMRRPAKCGCRNGELPDHRGLESEPDPELRADSWRNQSSLPLGKEAARPDRSLLSYHPSALDNGVRLDREVKMAKKFFHVCAGLFLLALSYH